ncbi:mechanosensitive ion channel domain-containing protein [uncultured Methanospirillum sp.]|uniref:mechanosensitive ion channel family protein n=1 Tax=uncultured Methanospirillum sp. TaxID=262503 RepID=UPI0029C8CB39|nr:mechanosensitive ion channel domain-containing protein [uncultured Methanospirillum sp.]
MANTSSLLTNLTNLTRITPEVANPVHLAQILTDPFWIISSILVLIFAYLVVMGMDFLLRILSEQLGTKRHILSMVIPILKIFVYLFAVYLIVSPLITLGIAELTVFSGLIGAGLGFGLKDLVADLVAGFIIILEKPYQIGDKITIDDYYGEVIDIGIIQTIIVTPGDSRVAIPNYAIMSKAVSSANAGSAEMMVITDLFLSYDANVDDAIRLLTEAVITSRYVYISETRPYVILVENHPIYRKILVKAYVNDLRHEFKFKSDITRHAWDAFQKAGIHPPDIAHTGYPIPISMIHT